MIKIEVLDKQCQPELHHLEDSCIDLKSRVDIVIYPMQTVLIPLGVKMDFGNTHCGDVKPRSSMSKRGVITHLGTIDNGYRGELKATITNLSNEDYLIKKGDRICQFEPKLKPTHDYSFGTVDVNSNRGSNGFGSTGK